MRRTLELMVALAAVVGLAGCKSRFACDKKSKCSADPPPLAWSVAECKVKMADSKCGALYGAWRQCEWDHATCDSHNRIDIAASTQPCTSDGQAYLRCEGIVGEATSAAPFPALPSGHVPLPAAR